MAKKKKNIQKFGDMPYGTWFKELRDEGEPRIFLKIQNILPSGVQVVHESMVAKDLISEKGEVISKAGKRFGTYFNAVDIDGITACCPDWIPFEVIEPPFKQRYKPSQGANLNLPRYQGDRMQGNA